MLSGTFQIYYTNDPMKILNMRIDSLAQMLNIANVRAGANYMVNVNTVGICNLNI